ncbi:hypothetical protein DH2020_034266 [Rehmannia glutinosa]|uniref:Protein kinase domain-containing protein n=1 Tax=Rehmannia glutinosa TaxID=99300 RepID=A0ABR0VAT2_REHGL
MPFDMGSSNNNGSYMPSRVLIVCDATKERSIHEFRRTIHNIRMQGGIVHPGDTIRVFGVLHKVLHPMGYQMGVAPENFLGATHTRALEEEVSKRLICMSACSSTVLKNVKEKSFFISLMVDIEVKITAGTPIRKVVIQEVATSNATWVIIDRHLRRELRFYLKHIPCKVALVLDNLTLDISRPFYSDKETDYIEDNKQFYSLSKPVPLPPVSDNENEQSLAVISCHGYMNSIESSDMGKSSSSFASNFKEQSFSSQDEVGSNHKQEESGNYAKGVMKFSVSPRVMAKQRRKPSRRTSSGVPVLCIGCGLKTEVDSMRYNYSDIQLATDDFSSDNLIGEGGYGLVYKGKLTDGQLIAAKVRKEASTQGFVEFQSELFVLSFARHKNIVMLLGYCCKENFNILVYEYICNKSLEWHLFDNPGYVLEWHRRHAIAIGIAKGLRFYMKSVGKSYHSQGHATEQYTGDFGLAKWKTDEDEIQTRILGTLGVVESGIVSVRTDVYAFGIVLIQLISGRKAVDYKTRRPTIIS